MCVRTGGMVAMGIIIGTCVPDAEQDSAYGAQIRRPPRRILYGMHFMAFPFTSLPYKGSGWFQQQNLL